MTLKKPKNGKSERATWSPRNILRMLGPGLITGAADDDPSGVATYSIAGAQNGLSLLWMAWVSWPFMACTQMMCARIGMSTGYGLAHNLQKKLPKIIVLALCVMLFVANIINIAADLAGMSDAMEMLTGGNSSIFIGLFGIGLCYAMIRFRYSQIANILKWLTITLFAYIVTPFILHPDWADIGVKTFTLAIPHNKEAFATIVGLLGTTISPYLFFWQSAQEIEEAKASSRRADTIKNGSSQELANCRAIDVGFGTFVSNLVMFFIMLTTGLTLHTHGITHIESSKDAAEALRPLAGHLAVLLYTCGLVSVGLISIPTLAGSSAYAFAEIYRWPQGLNLKFLQAQRFYGVMIISTIIGILLNFLHINPMKALLWSAIVNGVAAPFIMVGMLLIARDKKLMNNQPSSLASQSMVAITTLAMFVAAGCMFFV